MPVLLLAQGDKESRDLLRQAIEARYALQPPAIESLQVNFKWQSHIKSGPLKIGVPVDIRAYFHFPQAMRWDFTARKFGLSLRQGVETFDGTTYRRRRGSDSTQITDPRLIASMRQQFWVMAAVLLTPLNEHFVKLTAAGASAFDATNTSTNDVIHLRLHDDHRLDLVSVTCLNGDTGKIQLFTIRLSGELSNVDGLLLPSMISMFWDDALLCDLVPVQARNNIEIADEVFRLEANPPE